MKSFKFVCAIFVASAFARLAPAATYVWNSNLSGSFTTAANWTDSATPFGHAVPGAGDTAVFDRNLNVAYSVTVPGRQILDPPHVYTVGNLRVGTNTVNFSDFTNFGLLPPNSLAVNNGIFIGESAGQTAGLTTTLASFSGAFANIGGGTGSTGTLNVSGGVFNLTGAYLTYENHVGSAGAGALNISNGAVMNVAANLFLADNQDSTGALTIDGTGSVLASSAALAIGYHGAATLMIRNGGQLSSLKTSTIGSSLGTTSSVIVDGADSTWTNARDTVVGWDGAGTMTMRNGGQVSNSDGWIAYNDNSAPGSSGNVVVDGVGSTWTNTGDLLVAYSSGSSGALHVTAGGQVSSTNAYIGSFNSSSGSVVVDGLGSTWSNSGELHVGYVAGSGTLIVSNDGLVTTAGPLSVESKGTVAGNSHIAANVTNSGVVTPGLSTAGNLPGALHIGGTYVQLAAGKLSIELGGNMPGTDYDQLLITGDATINGTLQVSLLGTFMPVAGAEFNIIDGATLNGAFSNVQLPVLTAGLMWNASQLGTAGILKVTILGDYNANGVVDAADYTVWRNMLGQSGTGLAADGNADHMITLLDYGVWRTNYGNHFGSGAAADSNTTVPEPAAFVLLFVGMMASLTFRDMAG